MSDELDFELIDDSTDPDESTIETNEETIASEDDSKPDSEEDTSSTKSKKSNWKKMSKAMKDKDKKISDLETRLAKLESSSDDEEEDDFEDEEEISFDKTEFRFFTIENPEAKEYKTEMESTLQKYPDMSFEDALALVKAKTPKPSESSRDFSSKGSNVKVRKKLEDLTDEEASKLSGKNLLKYERMKGRIR